MTHEQLLALGSVPRACGLQTLQGLVQCLSMELPWVPPHVPSSGSNLHQQ